MQTSLTKSEKPLRRASNLASLFKDETGKKIKLTEGQQGIFKTILKREPRRNAIITPTRYGKSLTTALAVLMRAMWYPEKWAIVAPSEKQAKIIINYAIQHLFDNELFIAQLELDTSIERLKRERSKSRLTFIEGGEIFILSGDARNKARVGESLMGFGAPNLIIDESSLIDDDIYAKAKRMVGGHKDNFILEIGNPFRRNHFLRTWLDPNYNKIKIDWKQAVDEGRMSREFVEEMRNEAFFDILYNCNFPDESEVDERGWSSLIKTSALEVAMNKEERTPIGEKRLGVDIGRGGNFNVFVIRYTNYAFVFAKDRNPDLMATVGKIIRIMKDENIKPENVFIDDVGVGGGVTDRLIEQDFPVNPVKEGAKAIDTERFVNKKAEAYWNLRKWILAGGSLENNSDFIQLTEIRYKEDSSGKLKIEPKEEMAKRGIQSPDVADALMLTFVPKEEVGIDFI